MIRTRFAPSPTGYLHIGGVRTALFCWAFARKNGGKFILRIEDTDLERSTPESVRAILDGMKWVGLDYDEGPYYQTQRMDRYKEVIAQLLGDGKAYYCYASKEELDRMRADQMARGVKPRYDGRWRPEPGKQLPAPPAGVKPVVRFRNPIDGTVAWDDLVKGRIEISNAELDDLIIARGDGSPTYNFCVVVDDADMQITHVVRGDDHVNNTPRQINIFRGLDKEAPKYAHLPMILQADGQKMSKRRDAVSVTDYAAMGLLPEALLNYLARLGWGHGDEEFFTMQQFVEWFTLEAVSPAPSRFNKEKLLWLNQQHMKAADNARLAELIRERVVGSGADLSQGPALTDVIPLLKERVTTLNELADGCVYFYRDPQPSDELKAKFLTPDSRAVLAKLRPRFAALDWNPAAILAEIKAFCEAEGLKMVAVAMPLRAAVCGTDKTPPIDHTLALIGQQQVLKRIDNSL